MEKLLYLFVVAVIFLMPFTALSVSNSEPYTYFSMGYYYLYNNDLKMAKIQFKLCLESEKKPDPVIYTILSEISDMLGEKEEAEMYVTKALELDPDNEIALQFKTMFSMEKKEYEEAIIYIDRLLKKQPFNLQYLFYITEIYSVLEEDDKLIDVYIKILQINPDLIDIHLDLGYLYVKKGMLGLAKQEYQKVLEHEPENERAIFYLAYISLSEGNNNEALFYFRKLNDRDLLNDEMLKDYAVNLFIENQNPEPVLERIKNKENVNNITKAIQFFIDGNFDKAKEFFEMDIKENPDSIAGYTGLIRIAKIKKNLDMEKKWRFVLAGSYYNLHHFKKSLDEARRVKEIDPSFLENRYLMGDIYNNLGMVNEAIEEYEYFKKFSKEKGDIHIKLGLNYDEIGNHEESVNNFLLAIELFPENGELYYYLGIEYRILEDYENAVTTFRKAIELNEDNAYYYFNLGVSFERLEKIDEAIVYLDKSIQLDDTNAVALNYLGYLLADKGIRLYEAKELIEKALAKDPDNGAYLDSIGWVYYKLSEYEKAQEYLESAVKHMDVSEDENYLIYEHLGDTYNQIGLYKEAIGAWEKALQMKYVEEIQLKINRLTEK